MIANIKNPALLGLDVGTTNCKLIAYSQEGHILAEASQGYDVHYPQTGFAELKPEDIMRAVTDIFHEIAPAISECDDLSMAISAQGEAFLLVDSDGKSLSQIPISIDMRGRDLIAAFNASDAGKAACKIAGQTVNSLSTLSKLLWYKQEEPELLAQCAQVLAVGDYVAQQMGVTPSSDLSMASRVGLLDNFTQEWSSPLLDLAEIPQDILPPLAPSGTLLGTTTLQAAEKFGLNQPIKLYAGGHDQVCAMLGAGAVTDDTALYSIGTTEAIALTMSKEQALQHLGQINSYPQVIADQYVALMGSQSGGRVLDWLKALRGISDTKELLANMPDLPSKVTVLPHFAGSGSMLADENARAVFADLDFQTSPQDLTHAVLEGITMEQALALNQCRELGLDVKRLRAVGGGSRSTKWMQIKADIMGLPIDCMENADTACAGAAMLAGVGSGILASNEEAIERFARIGTTYLPREEYSNIYHEKLTLYYEIYRSQTKHQVRQKALTERIETLAAKIKDIK